MGRPYKTRQERNGCKGDFNTQVCGRVVSPLTTIISLNAYRYVVFHSDHDDDAHNIAVICKQLFLGYGYLKCEKYSF
ncbi:hypothetical protein DOY81_001302, partial [Sarcophaga bullata]